MTEEPGFFEFEFDWIAEIIRQRIEFPSGTIPLEDIGTAPELPADAAFQLFLDQKGFALPERFILSLTLAAAVRPAIFVPLLQRIDRHEIRSSFGGMIHESNGTFVPTFRTLIFLLAGNDVSFWGKCIQRFHSRHFLFTGDVLVLKKHEMEDSLLDAEVRLNDQYLDYFINENFPRLDGGLGFPAHLSSTKMNYEDVILRPQTWTQLEDVLKYIHHRKELAELVKKGGKIRTSYVVVFSGEPGTGKTITAKTIGKKYGIPVYIVNLARIVSKYIGETEKNLERVFDRFNDENCILFFDEADALFGKRMEVKDSKDRYANQDIAYLLQKIEEFNAVAILATNVQDVSAVFDKAFQRRIRRNIRFEFPDYPERMCLWESMLPAGYTFEPGLLEQLALNYQLTGASINNVLSDAIIEALALKTKTLSFELIASFLKIEFKKTERNYIVCTDEMVSRMPEMRLGRNIVRGNF